MTPAIAELRAHEILDSRGDPTLSVTAILTDCTVATAAVPAGVSMGEREAIELRDGDPQRYAGRGVRKAVAAVHDVIASKLRGMEAREQDRIDALLRRLDGTPNKAHLGANAMLGVSLAVARAAAATENQPLYAYLARLSGRGTRSGEAPAYLMPVPMIALINGGSHADNTLDVQEIMILPRRSPNFSEAVRCGSDIARALRRILQQHGLATAVGDAGGYAPNCASVEAAFALVVEAIAAAGYQPGRDVSLAVDVAASELFDRGGYAFRHAGEKRSADRLIEIYLDWRRQFPLVSIEDGLGEDDRAGWQKLTQALGKDIQLVGDDIFVTNPALVSSGVKDGIANAVLIKPNQIGTLSETLDAIRLAREAGYAAVISGRSGETEDSFIADLAVGTGAGQIKTGSPCRSERIAKYNRLLTIERDLGGHAIYGGSMFRAGI